MVVMEPYDQYPILFSHFVSLYFGAKIKNEDSNFYNVVVELQSKEVLKYIYIYIMLVILPGE